MDTDIKKLIGGGVLALLLTACGGGGGGGGGGDNAGAPTPSTRELPQEMAAVVDESNEFTNEFCPQTSGGQAPGASVDPGACVQEAEAADGGVPDPTSVVAQFCPVASESFDLGGLFDPTAFLDNLQNPQDLLSGGPLTFPLACLQESAGNLGQLQDLIGGSNPITEQLCPEAAAAGGFDPATCLAEIAGGAGGGLPEFPGTGGGGAPSIPGADGFCPTTAAGGFGPTTVLDCLNEVSRVYVTIVDQIRTPNPITEAVCPLEHSSGLVDPVACLKEGLAGNGLPGLPGLGDLPGLPGGGGGEGPGLPPELTDALGAICPDALGGEIGPTTPIDCLTEAGGNLGGLTDLFGELGGGNPLTDALCPAASGAGSLDPAACLTEALQKLPAGGGGGTPQIPGTGMLLEQICPDAAAGELGPTTPIACLSELGSGFGGLEDLLGVIGGDNPLFDQLCPAASEGGNADPAACFMEALESLPGALPLPGGDGGGGLPGADQLLGQICPATAEGDVGPTTPIDCLTEAGGNLGGLTDLLGGLGGSNPLTDALCPAASGAGSLDPAACITEALGNLPGAPGGDGGVPEIPGLGDGLAQICPNAAEAGLSPTLPLTCLMEVGGNFGQLQDLLGGLGGGLGGGEGGADPVTGQLCPEAGAGGLSPTLPLECLLEAGQNLPDLLTGLLGGLAP
ncbi:hypothetical protein ACLD0W_17495 [Alloalcanivorax sp. C16-1]|uniref:hypothetical protein n=1 Tax=Alloalcanivorax sp. C16-1 TaxID=3390051 RepID=UPI003970799A